jgi:hypothetical protein
MKKKEKESRRQHGKRPNLPWSRKQRLQYLGLTVVFFFAPYLVAGREPAGQPFFVST